MAHYELILDVDVNRIRVAKPKPVEMELASASKSKKKQKITWYYNGVTYKYDDDTEDSFLVMYPNIKISGISESTFKDEKTGKITVHEQVGTTEFLKSEIVKKKNEIRAKIIELVAANAEDVKDKDLWEELEVKNKKIKTLYWKSKEDPTKTRCYWKLSKDSSFYTPSKEEKNGMKKISRKKLTETEEVNFETEADVIELIKYMYVGKTSISIITELKQALLKKIAKKNSTPLFKKADSYADVDEDANMAVLNSGAGDDDDEEDEAPKKKKGSKKVESNFKKLMNGSDEDDDDEEEKKPAKKSGKKKVESDEEEDEDDNEEEKEAS